MFLRTREILQLAPEDVTMSWQKAVVFVKSFKGAKGTFLLVERWEIEEPSALQAIRELLKTASPSKPFWQESRTPGDPF